MWDILPASLSTNYDILKHLIPVDEWGLQPYPVTK